MKKIIKTLFLSSLIFSLFGCKKEVPCEHQISKDYFVSELTHGHKCEICGETLDEENHTFAKIVNKNYLKDEAKGEYYKSCPKCGKKSNETFLKSNLSPYSIVGSPIEMTFDQIVVEFGLDSFGSLINIAKQLAQSAMGFGELSFKRYKFNYQSTDYDDKPVTLSGALTIPYCNGKLAINQIVVDSHPTTPEYQAPSYGFEISSVSALIGSALIQCDLLGFGDSKSYVTNYHSQYLTGKSTAEGVVACYNILNDLLDIDTTNKKLFNIGYSQGGYDSMAFLKYMEQSATEDEKALIRIEKTFSGSGAYSVETMFKDTIVKQSFPSIHFIIMVLVTEFYYHNELFGEHKIEDFLTDFGKQYVKPIIEKDYSAIDRLNSKKDESGNLISEKPLNVFSSELLNPESFQSKIMNACFATENLTNGDWMPKGDLWIFYTIYDEVVSPNCSKVAISAFKDLPNFSYYETTSANHTDGAIDYYLSVINKIKSYL